ncbi:MAG: redox-sensing transcriptional repressor Rex [Chloroflexi bacterium]|nr:redox-sensing transcriptional repressor Rex [Chloroflexi bacterium CFX1]MCK6568534.1 redox-sensing transcriptional repressor Rex [Anaerolineales bacterium]MCQ3954513.1 redox-sensing transcriptional repressor Rex [Chloroflexota bacterium]MDL1919033.1 redox-sensing transcriptional repressor Rex [Chloroflexi bacterium CFX5]RIK52389.1 MAG: redox-sensing transcriptional repressor Rex [Chloroflexota bacterium]
MNARKIPDIIIGRLPVYLRALQRMSDLGLKTTSSQELGEQVGISAAQIRKDVSQFGEFGKQGTGYSIEYLIEKLREILKVNRIWDVVVVGAGDMGHALANYQAFHNRGFRVVAIFDNDKSKVGAPIGKFSVEDAENLAERIRELGVKIVMLTVPASAAQSVADLAIQAGVKAILNYAPVSLNVPGNVKVQYIDPSAHLQRMTYYL